MSNICDVNKCTGCRACENICVRHCINMKENEKGFCIPEKNEALCSNCNLCEKVCPILNEKEFREPLKIYAVKNKNQDIRSTSSSGGTFTEICKRIFEEGGEVYGAAFNDEIKVVHKKASNLEELESIKCSKYVQSDKLDVFKQVRKSVASGKKVLFSGTPCEVQALKNYKGLDLDKVFLLDIVCHGVPSPKVFEDYKETLEKKYNSKITNVNFRHKNEESVQNIKVDFENGETYISNSSQKDAFYYLFVKDFILRDSCYNCEFKRFNRISDISLGDFWGVEKGRVKDFQDKKGISLVLLNTEKGIKMFESIKEKVEYIEIFKEECEPYNCFSNFELPKRYEEFWEEYIKNGFKKAIDLLLEEDA